MKRLLFCALIVGLVGCSNPESEKKRIEIPEYQYSQIETKEVIDEMTDVPMSIISITPSKISFDKYGNFSHPIFVSRCEQGYGGAFETNYYLVLDEAIAYDNGDKKIISRIDKLNPVYLYVDEIVNNFYWLKGFNWHSFNEPVRTGNELKIQYKSYDQQVDLTYDLFKLRSEMRKVKNKCNWG